MFSNVASLSLILGIAAVGASSPSGLLADFQKSPALGVRAAPRFTWIVPPCSAGADHQQTSYQLIVSSAGKQVWDSSEVTSSDSTYVEYTGPALKSGTPYQWTVTTWTTPKGGGSPCKSAPSAPATFITALWGGWENSTSWIGLKEKATFGYFRKEVTIPSGVVSASAFLTGVNADPLLAGYKFYINGALVDIGPGRGEAPVWGGDGKFRSLPYMTKDVTAQLSKAGTSILAFEAMHQDSPSVILQIQLQLQGGKTVTVGQTDISWMAFNGDAHRKPGPATHGHSAGTGFIEFIDARGEPVGWKSASFKPDAAWSAAVTADPKTFKPVTPGGLKQDDNLHPKMEPPMQFTTITSTIRPAASPPAPTPPGVCQDVPENKKAHIACPAGEVVKKVDFASFGTPTGSCAAGFAVDPKCNSNHSTAVISEFCMGKQSCDVDASCDTFHEQLSGKSAFCWDILKSLAVKVTCEKKQKQSAGSGAVAASSASGASNSYIADFGREFQGGLQLDVTDGTAGQTVHIACGEAISGDAVSSTWGWEFDWTLREGKQTLIQHKYMECRWVAMTFSGTTPSDFKLSAWKVHYPYEASDSSFASSNATLDAVWELSRYTLEAASMDTYTDSNTRERRPYEADGIIAATARLLVQRDVLWPRHSHAWVINDPTWPVEWKQISPFLGWQDYMATGQADLALAFTEQMHDRTMIKYLDSTGTLDTSKMGRHIVDWMPDTPTSSGERDETVGLHEFTASNHMSVSNGFAAHGLDLMSQMIKAGNASSPLVEQFATESSQLMNNIKDKMWNGTQFCDGICSEVKGASLVMTNMFYLCFGMVPDEHIAAAWNTVADWGLYEIGDYGAFWYFTALASGYYAPHYDTPGDGSAVYKALTKCDRYSWCSGLRDDNLTMTRESWHQGTYSHQWGTSPIVGVVQGLMGVHVTAPGWASFTVKPKLGGLAHASVTVPTIRGFINVTASPGSVDVGVPCNTIATLCLPRSAHDNNVLYTPQSHRLMLDDNEVVAVATAGGHLCARETVSCGAKGLPRKLRAQPR